MAFLFIFSCHILQYFDNALAWWFNVGVQIFLLISGYLYGKKDIGDCLNFYRKNFIKILVPYFVVLLPMIILHVVFVKDTSVFSMIKAVLLVNTIPGGEHLWFIPTILMCYLITPLVNILLKKAEKYKYLSLYCFFLTGVIALFFLLFVNTFNGIWISCYVLGMVFGKFENKVNVLKNILLVSVLLNVVQIYFDYIAINIISNNAYYNYFCNMAHLTLGFFLFWTGKKVFSHIYLEQYVIRKVCDFSDKHSYPAYLFHQFVILGPLSLLEITNNVILNIVIVFSLTIIISILVKKTSGLITEAIYKLRTEKAPKILR